MIEKAICYKLISTKIFFTVIRLEEKNDVFKKDAGKARDKSLKKLFKFIVIQVFKKK